MPLVRVEMTEKLAPDNRSTLCAELSHICAETIGKPETYVMVVVAEGLALLHGGKPGPAAFVDVRSIGGLTAEKNQQLAQKLCAALTKTAKIPGERIYLNFTDVAAAAWAHDGSTFG